MHETIARLNIQHFRKELAEVSDQPAERDLDALVVGRRRKIARGLVGKREEASLKDLEGTIRFDLNQKIWLRRD